MELIYDRFHDRSDGQSRFNRLGFDPVCNVRYLAT